VDFVLSKTYAFMASGVVFPIIKQGVGKCRIFSFGKIG